MYLETLLQKANLDFKSLGEQTSLVLQGLVNFNGLLEKKPVQSTGFGGRGEYILLDKYSSLIQNLLGVMAKYELVPSNKTSSVGTYPPFAKFGLTNVINFFSPKGYATVILGPVSPTFIKTEHEGFTTATITVSVNTTEPGLISDLEKSYNSIPKEPNVKRPIPGSVYVLGTNCGSLALQELGRMHFPFIETNYTEKVVEDFKFVLKEFKRPTPDGRLAILVGDKGSGKTSVIKALVSSLTDKDALPILVPTHMLEQLQDPSFMSLLLERKGRRMVLILEDADRILAPRKLKTAKGTVRNEHVDINALSAILNLTDGLYGQLLDLYVVASTNADTVELDDALTRPGRLSRELSIGALPPERAMVAYKAIMGAKAKDGMHFDKPTLLANIYALCRKHGWSVDDVPKELMPGVVTDKVDAPRG